MKKRPEISFYTCVSKMMIRWCMVRGIWYATDGWTDGRKKWHIEVGGPPKKINMSNRVQLSLGWKKKKRTVNQIPLSKLCYIGQIYTIPKFWGEGCWMVQTPLFVFFWNSPLLNGLNLNLGNISYSDKFSKLREKSP